MPANISSCKWELSLKCIKYAHTKLFEKMHKNYLKRCIKAYRFLPDHPTH